MPIRDTLAQTIELYPGARLQSKLVARPETTIIKIRDRAARPVAGKRGLASVHVEDADIEIRVFVFTGGADDRDAVRARAVMTVADGARKLVQRFDTAEAFCFKDQIVVAEAVKFDELHWGLG